MMKKWILFILLIICFAIPVLGNFNYTESGNPDGLFELGTGFFNSAEIADSTDFDISSRTLSSSKQTPLVADLDGDGTNEIIILDTPTFKLFEGHDLIINPLEFVLPASERYSNFIVFDIDNDTRQEIIIVLEESNILVIIDYNGTVFTNQTSIDLSSVVDDDGEVLIKCGEVEECLMIAIDEFNADSNPTGVRAIPFNSTVVGNSISLTTHDPFSDVCFSKIRKMEYKNYDGDGDIEYIFSYHVEGQDVYIEFVNINDSFEVVRDMSPISKDTGFGATTTSCSSHPQYSKNSFTSPLVTDITGGGDPEIIVAWMLSSDTYEMVSYLSNGDELDDYPEIAVVDGELLGNVFRATIIPDSDPLGRDICIMGYEKGTTPAINLLCASEVRTEALQPEAEVFAFTLSDLSNAYNVSNAYGEWNIITHSAQHSTALTDGINLNEIVTSYGIFTIDYVGINELLLDFENPNTGSGAGGTMISVDPEKIDREQLLFMTDSNLFFYFDKFVDSPGRITHYYIDPCIDQTWQVNTSVEVKLTVTDVDDGNVFANATLYTGESFNQTQNSIISSSGAEFRFDFVANQTIGSSSLLISGSDVENPNERDELEFSISVGVEGINKGDGCITEGSIILVIPGIVPVIPTPIVITPEQKRAVREGLLLGGAIPAEWGTLVAVFLIIIIMSGVAGNLADKGIKEGMAIIYIPIFAGIAVWLGLVHFDMISSWTVVVSILLASAIIGFNKVAFRNTNGV